MSRRGENIFKRKDGRWEGRYKSGLTETGKTKYSSVYARTYLECSQKLQAAKRKTCVYKNSITFEQLFEQWLESRKNIVKRSTYMNYVSLYETHIRSEFAAVSPDKITVFMINQYISKLLESGGKRVSGLSANTVKEIVIVLKSVFKYGEITLNISSPAKNISLPITEFKEVETFSKTEMERIKNYAITGSVSDLGILLCLYTGMRIGEICALKWSDIDMYDQLISVSKTLYRIKNPAGNEPKTIIVTDAPKSRKSVRKIPVPTFMIQRLAEFKRNCDPENYFLTCSNRYIKPRSYRVRYKNFLNNLDIPYKNFHVLRHTFATECIRCGIDVKTVSELLGHSNVKITLDRYVHSSMDDKRRQLQKLYTF
ncbi:MAG: site-specific integrase [Eubacterium sp.]|nr:site-specific integrase [Eubacterium sp.]